MHTGRWAERNRASKSTVVNIVTPRREHGSHVKDVEAVGDKRKQVVLQVKSESSLGNCVRFRAQCLLTSCSLVCVLEMLCTWVQLSNSIFSPPSKF